MGKLATASYDFGCHATSNLCDLVEEGYLLCDQLSVSFVSIALLAQESQPPEFMTSPKLSLIVDALKDKFFNILNKHSLQLADRVQTVIITLGFPNRVQNRSRAYYHLSPDYDCKILVTDTAGKLHESSFSSVT